MSATRAFALDPIFTRQVRRKFCQVDGISGMLHAGIHSQRWAPDALCHC